MYDGESNNIPEPGLACQWNVLSNVQPLPGARLCFSRWVARSRFTIGILSAMQGPHARTHTHTRVHACTSTLPLLL